MPPATQIRGAQIADDSLNAADVVYSLDDAYDNGGSGSGRVITADAGAVVVDGAAGQAMIVSGTLELYGPSAAGTALKVVRGDVEINNSIKMGSDIVISSGSEGLAFSDQFGSRTLTQIRAVTSSTPMYFYGDGVDGDLTVTTTYTATRELFFQNLTINNGATFKPNGYRIFVRDTLTIQSGGSYNDNGINAVGMTSGSLMITRGFLDARTGAGGMGRNTTGPGIAGAGPTAGRTPRNASGVVPAGGRGGNCTGQTGGNGGSGSTGVGAQWGSSWLWGLNGVQGGFAGAMGGGGGACNITGGPAASGGGGGGAGIIWLAAKNIVNSGSISCNGGDGGSATSSGGSAGGGGGGGGGFICIVTNTPSAACGTVTCDGGISGEGAGTDGLAGAIGTVGYPLVFSFGDST